MNLSGHLGHQIGWIQSSHPVPPHDIGDSVGGGGKGGGNGALMARFV